MSNSWGSINSGITKVVVAILIVLGAWNFLADKNSQESGDAPVVPLNEQVNSFADPNAIEMQFDSTGDTASDPEESDLQVDTWQGNSDIEVLSPGQSTYPIGNQIPDQSNELNYGQSGNGFGQNMSDWSQSGGNNNAPNLQDWGDSMGQTYTDPTDDLQDWGNTMGQDFNDPYSNQQQWGQSMGQDYSQPLNQSSGSCEFPSQC